MPKGNPFQYNVPFDPTSGIKGEKPAAKGAAKKKAVAKKKVAKKKVGKK